MIAWFWMMGCVDGGKDSSTQPPTGRDEDHDGFIAVEDGGDDCNDQSPTTFPGAPEVWYDGVDQNCDGKSDFDRDADGEDSLDYGGTDCNDGNPNVNTAAEELPDDGLDNNCDGIASVTSSGLLALAEVMPDPLLVEDAVGQWFEVVNYGDSDIDVAGWEFTTAQGLKFTIGNGIVVAAGERKVFGAKEELELNGGVPVSYAWVDSFHLEHEDSLSLSVNGEVLWTFDWRGPDYPHEPGVSIALDDGHPLGDPTTSDDWCASKTPYGSGDFGSPGVQNGYCVARDEDGDGYSSETDCDDQRSDVYPGATEFLNGSDEDCDGIVDNLRLENAVAGPIEGNSGDHLGATGGLGVGYLRDSGFADLVISSEHENNNLGSVRAVIYPSTGVWTNFKYAGISGIDAGARYGATSPIAGDQTGDGVQDLLAVGADASGTRQSVVITMLPGGQNLAGDKNAGEGALNLSGGSGASGQRVVGNLDMNGDGIDEVLYGDPLASYVTFQSGRINIIDPLNASGPTFYGAGFNSEIDGSNGQDRVGAGLGGTDLNGDGYADAMVGAPGSEEDINITDGGSWSLLNGGASLPADGSLSSLAAARFYSNSSFTGLGYGSPAFGDFDGDGNLDLALGSFSGNKVWIFMSVGSSASGGATFDVDQTASLTLNGSNHFGFALSAGDFIADGLDDLLVGAPAIAVSGLDLDWDALPGTDAGAVFVYDAVAAGTSSLYSIRGNPGDLLGSVFGGSLDINGDSTLDVAIAAPQGANAAGQVWVYNGRPKN